MGAGISVFMAIVDFVPVILFFLSARLLQKDLYGILVKGAYSVMAGGSMMVLIGGFFKALWKIMYAMGVCDYVLLNHSFFPLQGPGFLLFFWGVLGMFYKEKNTTALKAAAPVTVLSTMPFIVLQVIGLGGAQIALSVAAGKSKNKKAIVYFVISFIFMLGMGYLGAKFDDSSRMHWIAQVTNIISQGAFFLGTYSIHKSGLSI